jgi:hypothetical protein
MHANKRESPTFSRLMMLLSFIAQGLYFWARDAVTQHLPTQFFLSDVVWAVTLCSLVVYRRYPWVTPRAVGQSFSR